MANLAADLAAAQTKVAEYENAIAEALEAQRIALSAGGGGMDRQEEMASLRDLERGLATWRRRVQTLEAQTAGKPTIGGMRFTSARFGDYTSNRS